MNELQDRIAFKIAEASGVDQDTAHLMLADVIERSLDSPHFAAVRPAAQEVLEPLWVGILPVIRAFAPVVKQLLGPPDPTRWDTDPGKEQES